MSCDEIEEMMQEADVVSFYFLSKKKYCLRYQRKGYLTYFRRFSGRYSTLVLMIIVQDGNGKLDYQEFVKMLTDCD